MPKRRSTSDSVRAAVGSSMMSTRALMERALAISTRWRLPTLSVPTLRWTSMSWMFSEARISRARSFMAPQSTTPMRPTSRRGAWPMKMFSATVSSG